MLMQDIIIKKKEGKELTREELSFFINGYVNGSIPDYQVSALLMAICFKSMTKEETANLTDLMMHSGEVVDLSSIKGIKVDKHSTGGVGDKTSMVLGPLVASCGVKLAKMSGRGLGFTGGTLDKLESIKGMSISLSKEQFLKQVQEIGISIIGQTGDLVPADKKLYALRDVTGTIDSIPLIASSIMSKKLASGADTILLDVKFGSGAFMKTLEDAKKLAQTMVDIGKSLSKDTRAVLTDMEQPLGLAIGNILEVKEAIDTLKGKGPKDFYELCIETAKIILMQAKVTDSFEEAQRILEEKINNGEAFAKFKQFIKYQGGDLSYIDNIEKFDVAKNIIEVKAQQNGYIHEIKAIDIGLAAMHLGAGRATKEDSIDYTAGIVLTKKVGDYVEKDEVIAYLHTNKNEYINELKEVKDAFVVKEEKKDKSPIIYDVIF